MRVLGMSAVVQVPIEREAGSFGFPQMAREQVTRWSDFCQKFLDCQKKEVMGRDPSQKTLQEHRDALTWPLRFGTAIYFSASDPDYPDKWISSVLRGRL